MAYTPANTVEAKALALLGKNYPQEAVASALGVTPGRISQLMAQEPFAAEVAKLRYENLQAVNERDSVIDTIEDKLLTKLDKMVPLINDPLKVAKIWKDVNAAKRRGSAADTGQTLINQTVINLTLPTAVVNKFKSNNHSQVIEIDGKPFVTAQPQMLEDVVLKEHGVKENETRRSSPNDSDKAGESLRISARANSSSLRERQAISAEDL